MKKRTIAFVLILLLLITSFAFAYADNPPALTVAGSTITADYGNSISNRTVVTLSNTLPNEISITKIENSNAEKFVVDTTATFSVPSGEQYVYPVRLVDDQEPGTYSTTITFTDANNNTYPASVSVTVAENFKTKADATEFEWGYENPLVVPVTLSNFTKHEMKITGATSSNTEFKISDLTNAPITLEAKQNKPFDVSLPVGKETGIYQTKITFTDETGQNYEQDITVKIVPKKLIIPAIVGTYVYSGEKQKLELDSNYDETLIGVSEDYGEAVNAHSYAPVLYLKDPKNTVWKNADGSTTTTNQTLSWVIERYPLPKPSAENKEYTYNAQEQSFSIENLTEQLFGKTVLSVSGDKKTNAGTTTVTVSIVDKQNFKWEDNTTSDVTFTWEMLRKKITVPSIVTSNYDYDGTPHSIEFASESIDDTLVTVQNNERTEQGTQDVTVQIKDKVNYEWNTGNDTDLTFVLAISEPVYNLPLINGTYTYNGQTQHLELAGFDAEHMTIKDDAKKNAGDYPVTIMLKYPANAKWADTNTNAERKITWSIAKKDVLIAAKTITANVGDPVPALNADHYTVTGIIKPDSLGFFPVIHYENNLAPTMTQTGEYKIVVEGDAETQNYTISYQSGKLIVGKPQAENILSSVNVTFDLPTAGMVGNQLLNFDNLAVSTSFASVDFARNASGHLCFYEQDTDNDITDDIWQNGLSENKKVYVKLIITTNSGKVIDKAKTNVTVNGIALGTSDKEMLSAGGAKIPFTVPAFRIHFSKGVGSGIMATEYANTATDYEVPKSTFASPSGKEFANWLLKGTSRTYTSGQKIRLTESINLVAQYNDKVVIPTPGGGSGGGGFAPSGGVAGPAGPAEITPTGEVQKPTITANNGTVVATSKDGTAVTFTPDAGYIIMDVIVNGKSVGAFASVTNLKTGDIVECITQNKAGMQALMNNYALTARSKNVTMKNGKSAIRISWFDRNGDKMDFDGVAIQRSTKRYSGFKKMFDSNRNKYYNTNIKTGTKYYYRVRGYVLFNGEKVYTDWSLKAFRAVGK